MIKKGKKVIVLTGKDKKKEGEVIEIDKPNNRAKVKEINMVKKHIKNTDRTVRCSKNSLEVKNTVSLPDGYSTTSVKIEFKNSKELSYYAKDHQIENYKHSKDIYIVHVKLLGDPDIDYVVTENIREDKIFKINEKDNAYEYFNHLFQKNILYLWKNYF